MKYYIVALAILSSLLIGCMKVDNQQQEVGPSVQSTNIMMQGYEIVIDPETGCEYLINPRYSALTIRYDRNGQPMCKSENIS